MDSMIHTVNTFQIIVHSCCDANNLGVGLAFLASPVTMQKKSSLT